MSEQLTNIVTKEIDDAIAAAGGSVRDALNIALSGKRRAEDHAAIYRAMIFESIDDDPESPNPNIASQLFHANAENERLTARAIAAERELAELRERTRWIPVNERLPEVKGKYAIIVLGDIDTGYFNPATKTFSYFDREWVTHWSNALLPVPPEAENA